MQLDINYLLHLNYQLP